MLPLLTVTKLACWLATKTGVLLNTMKLPLLLGARPLFVKQGALIPLGMGSWNVTGNHTDSQICLDCIIEDVSTIHSLPVTITGPAWVRVKVDKPGSENSLDVYAERL